MGGIGTRCGAAALFCAVAIGTTWSSAGAIPLGDVDSDQAAVDLLDDALEAIEDGDDETWLAVTAAAQRGDVWLPDLAIHALEQRDSEYIVDFANALDADNSDLAEVTLFLLEIERDDAVAIPNGELGSVGQQTEFRESDVESHAYLQMLDHRGIDIPVCLLYTSPSPRD